MAVLGRLRDFWSFFSVARPKVDLDQRIPRIAPTPPDSIVAFADTYDIRPLTLMHLDELFELDQRCFTGGEAYTRETLEYLLNEPKSLCYRAVLPGGAMIGFIITMLEDDGTGHITTIGVAPEFRRRGIAYKLLERAEDAYRKRNVRLIRLEVRTINIGAQDLYRRAGYSITQRLPQYYSNGGDGLLMVKSLV